MRHLFLWKLSIVTLAALVAGVGCTRVVVHKDPGFHDKGVRFYRPKPYLFITPDDGGGGGGDKALFTVTQPAPLNVNVTGIPTAGKDQGQTPAKSSSPPKGTGGKSSSAVDQPDAGVRPAGFNDETDTTKPPPGKSNPGPVAGDSKPAPARPGTKISIKMVYMPDFGEEYSIQMKPGLGVGQLNVNLENGWNLTTLGIQTDQKTAEIIQSTASLVSAIGGIAKPVKAQGIQGTTPDEVQNPLTVLATNIPFGFYEAVIATDPTGKKQLYGWRYVGFMPFQACPTIPGGATPVCCNDPDAIYGLVMNADGILQFEKIAVIPTLPRAVLSGTAPSSTGAPAPPLKLPPAPAPSTR